MFEVIKNAINLDAHMYEINKEKLKQVYNIPTKSKKEYEIIEKKVIYAKDEKKVFLSREEMERNYFSNYKYFRDYLITGFESEETKGELQEIKQLIENSKTLRENLMKHFDIQMEEGGGNQEQENNSSHSGAGSLMMKNKFLNNFAKMCKLLKFKENSDKTENTSVFKLYSELNNPSDVYSFSINENFLTNKLLNFKKKLTESYYKEEFFCNFAKNYFNSSGNNTTSDNIPQEIRQKFPVDYIDSIFRPRENEVFYKIDSFMSIYGITQKANLYEKDLYENIYGILSKCNYANFMSYLYSKNNLFKYIYDEFALKRVTLSESLENVNLSRIESIDETDKFFKNSELLISPKSKGQNAIHHARRNTIRSRDNFMNIDEYLANYFLDKICFLNEKIEEKIAEVLVKDTNQSGNASSSIQGQFIKGSIINLLNALINRDFGHILLLSRNERIKVFSYTEDIDTSNKIADIDEEVKRIQIYRIDKKFILDKFPALASSFNKEQAFRDIFTQSTCFFLLEVKRMNQMKRNSVGSAHKFSLSNSNAVSNYHLFRVTNENVERFELVINQLKLYIKAEDRLLSPISPIQDSFSNNPSTPEPSPISSKPKERDATSLRDINDDKKKTEKKLASNKSNKRVSQYDDDFLGISNNDILNEVLYQRHVVKKDNKENANSKKGLTNADMQEDEEGNNFDFRNLIDKEQQKKSEKEPVKHLATISSSNLESSPDNFILGQGEINFKENYMFRINNVDHKFSFTETKGQIFLAYYRFSPDEEDVRNSPGKKNTTPLTDFKDYMVAVDEGKDYHRALIQLRYNDTNKSPLEIISYVKSDYLKFINKIDKYVKKA